MAEELDFESFDNLEDLDWSELEKDIKEKGAPAEGAAPAQSGAPAAANAGGGAIAAQVSSSKTGIDINYLLDVNLHVTVVVGRRTFFINQVLGWEQGSVIEMDKLVGEPVDFLINNKPVAKGEVVVVNDKFSLKITEIIDPNERLHSLRAG